MLYNTPTIFNRMPNKLCLRVFNLLSTFSTSELKVLKSYDLKVSLGTSSAVSNISCNLFNKLDVSEFELPIVPSASTPS